MENSRKIFYYKEYTDDLVENSGQHEKLPEDYKWVHKNIFYNIFSHIVYLFFWIFGYFYCKIGLRVKVKNRKVLRKYRNSGYFIYGNHTQPMGDVFIPSTSVAPQRIYVVVNPANLGIPIIGGVLPMIGALPIPDKVSKMKLFHEAISKRIKQRRCVVIYPEAHVWPYYTKIRPFPETAFKFPVNESAPAFCMTTTYQKAKVGDKPKITVYIDGPFLPDDSLPKTEQIKKLHDDIYNCMNERSKESNYEYFGYERV